MAVLDRSSDVFAGDAADIDGVIGRTDRDACAGKGYVLDSTVINFPKQSQIGVGTFDREAADGMVATVEGSLKIAA